MSLTSALNNAQSIFNNVGVQTSVASNNISNVGNANYVRRAAVLGTTDNGASVVSLARSQNASLFRQTIESISLYSGQNTLLTGLEQMKSIMGGNDYETSPSTAIAAMLNSIQTYATTPSNSTLGATVISSAQDVVASLNNAAKAVQDIRTQADKEIKAQVDKLNKLLADFDVANTAVKSQTASGEDPSNALDQRDTLVKQISEIVGVSSSLRTNNDMVLYTSDGVTLFESGARKVSFVPSSTFDAATTGNSVYIDGVALDAGTEANTTAKGSLSALLQLRDEVAPVFQTQLDEIARGLITIFAESDPAGVSADKAGLFTSSALTNGLIPATGVAIAGLAGSIKLNPAVVSNPSLLRDGGINAGYVANTSGGSSYSTLLDSYVDGLKGDLQFDSGSAIDTKSSILSFASASIGWLEGLRSTATNADEVKTAALTRSTDAYSNVTGVSLDEELSLLLDLEQSYKAASKLLTTIDQMLQSLLDAAS